MLSMPRRARVFKSEERDFDLLVQAEAFLIDRYSQNFTKGTLYFYKVKLKTFVLFCSSLKIYSLKEVDANLIRNFVMWLQEKGHNAGGIRDCFRAVKTFLYWWEREVEPEGWQNPIREKKVKLPKQDVVPLKAADLKAVDVMLETCVPNTFYGDRDRAILMLLVDTGMRAQEFCDLNLQDIDLTLRSALVVKGKGRKSRMVFFTKRTAHFLRMYLRKHRQDDDSPAMWIKLRGGAERLTYWGLRQIVERRAKLARVKPPSLHSFRRLFALQMLRKGADINSLRRLMGHSDLTVLMRYLDETNEDLKNVYDRANVVGNWTK
jgi:site-specific recombinase XerD